jgi:hypothetical protein
MRGSQYAAAYRFNHCCLWDTGSSACADDDSECVALAMPFSKTRLRIPAACFARALQIVSPKKRGRRECRVHAAPAVSCAKLCEETHTSIQVQRRQSGIPRAMALRLMPCSSRRRIRLVTVIDELAALRDPVGLAITSADLTPATGARTTRFCRTPQRRSSYAGSNRSQPKPPYDHSRALRCRVHRIPHSTYRDDAYAPLR